MISDRRQIGRSGVAILLVLICLIVITTIVGAMLRYLLITNRQIKQRMHATQAFWLADSGLERAVYTLAQNSDYRQETWNAAPDSFDGRIGQVEIQVEEIPDDPSRVTVTVLATFPKGSTFAVKARRKVAVALRKTNQAVAQSTDEEDQDEKE